MNFIIRQNSTMPVLTVEVTQDGYNSSKTINQRLENAVITFYMEETVSCIPTIQCGVCCITMDKSCNDCPEKVYIQYKWKPEDTLKKGKYRGRFEIVFNDDNSVFFAPIRDTLNINIL